MKFRVTRTSTHRDKPCEEATTAEFPSFDIRTCNEEYFNEKLSEREGLWRSKGTEHSITKDGYISRRRENEAGYSVSINSMNGLIAFVEKYGECVVSIRDGYTAIEIYDDYRE